MTVRQYSREESARRRSGLSLIDLCVTLLILGVMAGVAVPRYIEAVESFRVDAAAKRLAADLTHARERAIARSVSQSVQFDTAGGYTLVGVSDPDRPSQTYRVDLTAPPFSARVAKVSLGTNRTVTFNIYGQPGTGGEIVLGAGGSSRTVSVDTTSGRVSIE